MIEKMFNGPYLRQLDNIVQWSEMDVFQRESVSQHSFKVAVFVRVLLDDIFSTDFADNYQSYTLTLYKFECVEYALFHDFDEALIRRDISHVTKYNSFNGEQIRKNLNELSEHLANEQIKSDKFCGQHYYDLIVSPSSKVKRFVKLCDWLAMAFFIRREICMGNRNMRMEDTTVYNGIRNSVNDVKRLFTENEFFSKFNPDFTPLDTIMKMIYEQRN